MAITRNPTPRSETLESYPLAPMQEGMLFHSLCGPHDGFEIEQLICDMREPLDAAAFKRAWGSVTDRHAVLRTGFQWEGLSTPVQQVWQHVVLPWAEQDWSDLSAADQEDAFATFLQTDRARGFDLNEPPLQRLTLFRLGDATFRFVWTFHHALLDGRSFPVVLQEVFSLYQTFQNGGKPHLRECRPYRDYIDWLGDQNFDHAESFWRKRLKGFGAPTPLIATAAHMEHSLPNHGAKETALLASTTDALQSLARENELTLNTLVQAAWALLLSRYNDEEDVVFGAVRACRRSTLEGAESMVGLFINTLPVRIRVKPESELLPWLKEVRLHWLGLREFERTPLVKVQRWSEVPAETPLFESIVVFENSSLNELLHSAGGAWLNREFRLIEQPAYPLTLAAHGGDELLLKIFFDRTRFDDDAIVRMLGHLKTLLSAMASNPRQRVCELPLLTEEEKSQLLIEWNEPRMNFSPGHCLHQLFEAHAERAPDAVAIVLGDKQVTYGELNRRADQVADSLQKRGVCAETLVAICMERSIDLIVGIIGILKAGGAYLPIDPSCPRERTFVLLEDSRVAMLLTQHHLLPRLPSCEMDVICIDVAAPPKGETKHCADHLGRAHPGNLAYVIYTSGSTGKPKGVTVTHYNVVRLFQATRHWFHFDHTDVWTLFHSPAFDFSVWEIWGALLHGGKLVIVPHAVSRSPGMFYKLLEREKVTVLNQTPSAFRQLIQVEQELTPETPLALRWIIFGGEALDPQSLKLWFDRHDDDEPRLVNMYGITETTVHVTYRPLKKDDVNRGSVIGSPIPDLQIYLLDSRQEPVPIGVPGEIYVGGAGVARGYLHRSELTAERFVPNPFSKELNACLYKTGDRARFLPGRDIEYLGRVDDQIKIRGFRVEPGEIESVLVQHPLVREAVVMVRQDRPDDKRLVAYAVTRQPAPPAAELRSFLRERLPDYMVPSAVMVLDKLPLTSNGKLDRRELPPPDQPQTSAEFVAPRTTLERTVADIWQELLGVKRVGLHDNFFEMGGHSLLLAQLHYRLQSTLRRDVPITTLFQYPTLNALAKHLSGLSAHAPPRIGARVRRIRELQEASVV